MKTALFIMSIVLLLCGMRCINVNDDIVTACVAGGLAIICFYAALIYDDLKQNKEVD